MSKGAAIHGSLLCCTFHAAKLEMARKDDAIRELREK